MPLDLQIRQRKALDRELLALGRDPAQVGIVWQQPVVVAETEREAHIQRDRLLSAIPPEGVGVYLSHNAGYDFSTLPQQFTLGELHAEIIAVNASPVGFVRELAHQLGSDTSITRKEFFEHGLRFATGYARTLAGTPAQVADRLEEAFEATGGRGGFMLGHVVSMPFDLENIVDLLIPELQRRGRFRRDVPGTDAAGQSVRGLTPKRRCLAEDAMGGAVIRWCPGRRDSCREKRSADHHLSARQPRQPYR